MEHSGSLFVGRLFVERVESPSEDQERWRTTDRRVLTFTDNVDRGRSLDIREVSSAITSRVSRATAGGTILAKTGLRYFHVVKLNIDYFSSRVVTMFCLRGALHANSS